MASGFSQESSTGKSKDKMLIANVRNMSLQISFEESFHFVVRNHTGHIVVEINMGSAGDDHKFFIGTSQQAVRIFAEIASNLIKYTLWEGKKSRVFSPTEKKSFKNRAIDV